MARQSNPGKDYLSSGANGYIRNVWDLTTDLFDHLQLRDNWDAIDANLGRLDKERHTLGDLKSWYMVDTSIDPIVFFPNDGSKGWVICDGRSISAGSHGFRPGGGADIRHNGVGLDASNILHLPDFRGQSMVGAGVPAQAAVGVAAPSGTHVRVEGGGAGDGFYGGIGGVQGGSALVAVPDHHHRHSHVHQIGDGASNGVTTATVDDSNDQRSANLAPTGSGTSVTLITHEHQLFRQYTSVGRDPTNALKRFSDIGGSDASLNAEVQTSKQIPSTGGTSEVPTPTTGPGGALSMDARPASIGTLILMYVRHAT